MTALVVLIIYVTHAKMALPLPPSRLAYLECVYVPKANTTPLLVNALTALPNIVPTAPISKLQLNTEPVTSAEVPSFSTR